MNRLALAAALLLASSAAFAVNPPPSQPVTGTLSITDVSGAAAGTDITATGTLGSANARVSVAIAGRSGCSFSYPSSSTLVGTLVPEVSFDGGTTWLGTGVAFHSTTLANNASATFAPASGVAGSGAIIFAGGPSHCAVRVSVYTSGTTGATAVLRATTAPAQYQALFAGSVGAAAPPEVLALGARDGASQLQQISVTVSGTAAPATQLPIGGRAVDFSATSTSPQAAAAAGNGTQGNYDTEGRMMVVTGHPRISQFGGNTSATTISQLLAAPSATLAFYINTFTYASAGATGTVMLLSYGTGSNCGTGTTNFFQTPYTVNSPIVVPLGNSPIRIPANNNVCTTDAGTGSKYINVVGWSAP